MRMISKLIDAYVALSRAENLSDCIVEPTSFDRLQNVKKSEN